MPVTSVLNEAARLVGAIPSGPVPLYGVAVDAVDSAPVVVDTLSHLLRTPTMHTVFDGGMGVPHYVGRVAATRGVAYVVGELADSSTLKQYTTSQLRQRATAYLHMFADSVDIWEISNEINGE